MSCIITEQLFIYDITIKAYYFADQVAFQRKFINHYSTDLFLLIPMLWHRQAVSESKGGKLPSSAECRIRPRVSDPKSPADWMPADKPIGLSIIKPKTWTRQPVPMVSKSWARSTLLPVGFRTWLWCCTCLLLISMLWPNQAVFESKGDQLSCFAECRIRTQRLRHQITSRLNARWQTDQSLLYMHSYHKQTDPVIHRHLKLNPITCTFLPLNIATEILNELYVEWDICQGEMT